MFSHGAEVFVQYGDATDKADLKAATVVFSENDQTTSRHGIRCCKASVAGVLRLVWQDCRGPS